MAKRQYEGNTTGTGPSPGIWADCPIMDMIEDPNSGHFVHYDFATPINTSDASGGTGGIFSQDDVTSGKIVNVDLLGGGIEFDSDGNNAADDGINAQMLTDNGGEYWAPAVGQTLWFETRARFVDAATTPDQHFVGLCDRETAIMTGGELDSTARNMIGFFTDSGTTAGRIEFVTAKAGSAEEQTDVTSAAAVADLTWVNLGFKVYTTVRNALRIIPYVDGVAYTELTDADDIPLLLMAPSFVAQVEQTSANAKLRLAWLQIARSL